MVRGKALSSPKARFFWLSDAFHPPDSLTGLTSSQTTFTIFRCHLIRLFPAWVQTRDQKATRLTQQSGSAKTRWLFRCRTGQCGDITSYCPSGRREGSGRRINGRSGNRIKTDALTSSLRFEGAVKMPFGWRLRCDLLDKWLIFQELWNPDT